jgi:exoribonuclease-2
MNPSFDLRARAHRAMLDAGFQPDFPAAVLQQIQSSPAASPADSALRDLRSLLWSSIDNDSSRDLDQIEYAESLPDGAVRLLVGLADVDWLVPAGSPLDQFASAEATSVYTGVVTFPMLPPELSNDRTSLAEGQDRRALVVEMHVLPSGDVDCHDLYPAWVQNHAKLAYSSTGGWLEQRAPMPAAIVAHPGLESQLRLQQQIAQRLRRIRQEHGALTFSSLEPIPVLEDGRLKELALSRHNVAEDIIESFMVAANIAMAQFLKERGALAIRRVVRTPKRWDRIREIAASFGASLPEAPDPRALSGFLDQRRSADPQHFADLSLSVVKLLGPGEYIVEHQGAEQEGHFGLAAQDYTHSTAPNRRYADLVTQRLLKAASSGAPGPYSEEQLTAIAAHCTDREDAARKVERLMRKVMAASLLSARIGQVFSGIITGASPKGTYARLLQFPAEGRILHPNPRIDVGDNVQVRLTSVDVPQGFIDFDLVAP